MADSSQWESGCIGDCYASLLSQQVGVVPFVLVKGLTSNPAVAGILASVHNLSSMQLRILLGGGGVANPSDGAVAPLSQLTGDASAISYAAIVVGYNCGSGERLDTFLEAGFGVGPLSAPMQYLSGGEMLNDRLNGFQSPDALIAALNIPISAAHNFAVFSYLSIADAARLTSVRFNSSTGTFSGGPILTYNGVPFSYAAVCEGSYSLWNYEYLLSRRSLAGEQSTVIAGIGNQIATVDAAASGLLLDSMRVSRNSVTEVISTIASPAVD